MLRFPRRSAPGPPGVFHCTRKQPVPRLLTRSVRSAFSIRLARARLAPCSGHYNPEQDKLVAVKLFRLDLPPERVHELVADFERMIAADLTHSAIVAVVATGIVQVSPYLAQDFVAADSLDTVIREHEPAPAAEALRSSPRLPEGSTTPGSSVWSTVRCTRATCSSRPTMCG